MVLDGREINKEEGGGNIRLGSITSPTVPSRGPLPDAGSISVPEQVLEVGGNVYSCS